MLRNRKLPAALGALAMVALAPMTAHGADRSDPDAALAAGFTGLRICTSTTDEAGTGQFVVEGSAADAINTPFNRITPVLNFAGSTAGECWDQVLPAGIYRITPGKYLSAKCLKTVNGQPVQKPVGNPDSGLEYSNTARCEAMVHHFHTRNMEVVANGAANAAANDALESGVTYYDAAGTADPKNRTVESTLEQPEIVVTVTAGRLTFISAHIVDVRYPDCTAGGSPANQPERRCEPTGATTS